MAYEWPPFVANPKENDTKAPKDDVGLSVY